MPQENAAMHTPARVALVSATSPASRGMGTGGRLGGLRGGSVRVTYPGGGVGVERAVGCMPAGGVARAAAFILKLLFPT
jgi:hypothetical protein